MRFALSIFFLTAAWLLTASHGYCADAPASLSAAISLQLQRSSVSGDEIVRPENGPMVAADDSQLDPDDDTAIPDETPVAHVEDRDGGAPGFEPLGMLRASLYALPAHRLLARQPSRAPPAS
jgi:hypothetical protein